ncbi:MAG: hypothetical protein ACFFCV_04820 [Promethearchaeota archaeon]
MEPNFEDTVVFVLSNSFGSGLSSTSIADSSNIGKNLLHLGQRWSLG